MDNESVESTEEDAVRGARTGETDRETGMRLMRSRELIPETTRSTMKGTISEM